MLGIKATNSLYKSNPQSTKEMYIPLYFDIDINACFNARTERVCSTLLHLIETYKKKSPQFFKFTKRRQRV